MDKIIEYAIIALLAVAIALSVFFAIRRARKGSACCGEKEKTVKKVKTGGKDKSGYPYSASLKISGMTCQNCARHVENALNANDGIIAHVDKNTDTARILSKEKPDIPFLCAIVAKAGYSAEEK